MYLSYVYTLLDEAHSFGGALVVQAKDIHAYSCTSISLMERSKLYYPQLPPGQTGDVTYVHLRSECTHIL